MHNIAKIKNISHILTLLQRIFAILMLCLIISPNIFGQNTDADTIRGKVLQEITVNRKREHYSKRHNPAVDFVNKIREARDLGDPKRHDHYNYEKYERFSLGLHDFYLPPDSTKKNEKFAFLREHIDTSEVTHMPILPLSVKEKGESYHWRKDGDKERHIIHGMRQTGIDEMVDMNNIQIMLEDIFREIDLYDNDINLLQNRFVSPLSPIAPDFYKFYLTDTVNIDGTKCVELSFAPRNPATFSFIGRLYVEAGDTTMFVKQLKMGVTPTVNLNFVDWMQIEQRYTKAPDGSRLKTIDDLFIVFSIMNGTQPLYARRTTTYDRHNFLAPENESIFNSLEQTTYDADAYEKDEVFWEETRQIGVTKNEKRIPQLLSRLRQVPLYYWGEQALKLFVVGYVPTGAKSKFDFGPLNTTISGNPVEGVRLRVGGMTTSNLNPHWFSRGYIAYGTKDRKLKYSAEIEYSFNDKKYHSREFPVHSIRLTEKYDINQVSQHYDLTNPDNVLIALKRKTDKLVTYCRQTRLDYNLELPNNFSIAATANWERQQPGPYVPFTTVDNKTLRWIDQTIFSLQLRYAPGEKFYQNKTTRYPINLDAPILMLRHTYSPKNFLGSNYCINITEASAQKRFWFSAWGFADVIVKGGHVWSRNTPWLYLLSPNANLTYTIVPESFTLLNPMEFAGDSSVQWDVTYWLNGAILNYIPLIKKLKLRETVGFRGYFCWMSNRNKLISPDELTSAPCTINSNLLFPCDALGWPMPLTASKMPYMEISAGLDNIFKCLRIDYVWRLTYRDQPGISRSGLRATVHITF